MPRCIALVAIVLTGLICIGSAYADGGDGGWKKYWKDYWKHHYQDRRHCRKDRDCADLGEVNDALSALQDQVDELGQQVATLANRVPAECSCFDAPLLARYDWGPPLGVGGVAIDADGNDIADIVLRLAGPDSGASITVVTTTSPAGELLRTDYFCTFESKDTPPVSESNLTEGEYRACEASIESLVRRRFP